MDTFSKFFRYFQIIWEALRDLVSLVQLTGRENHQSKSGLQWFTNVAHQFAYNFTKTSTPQLMFSRFSNYANGTKSRKASNIFLELHLKSCSFREYLLETFVVVVKHWLSVSNNFVAIDKHNLYSVHLLNPVAWQETDWKLSRVQGNYK